MAKLATFALRLLSLKSGDQFREARSILSLSKEQLAQSIGIDAETITTIETMVLIDPGLVELVAKLLEEKEKSNERFDCSFGSHSR